MWDNQNANIFYSVSNDKKLLFWDARSQNPVNSYDYNKSFIKKIMLFGEDSLVIGC